MKRFVTLLKIELKLSLRDMNMVIFAIILPLVALAILGLIDNSAAFLTQSFGALCAIAICASGLMGLPLVLADYRERQILKRFQVTPSSPAILDDATIATKIALPVESVKRLRAGELESVQAELLADSTAAI